MKRFAAILLCCAIFIALVPHGSAADIATPAVHAGRYHSLMLRPDGKLYAWGDNRYGQMGDGTAVDRSSPIVVLDNVVSAAAGHWASYAVTSGGHLYAWGNNEQGQLGLGDYTSRSSPTRITSINGAKAVAAAHNRAYILLQNGDVYAFGNSPLLYPMDVGRLSNVPKKIAINADMIFAGGGATMFLRGSRLTGYGSAIAGSLNSDKTALETLLSNRAVCAAASSSDVYYVDAESRLYRHGNTPTLLLSGIAQVAVSDAHCTAVGTGGLLYTWGTNSSGELGHGSADTSRAAQAILRNIAGASAGDGFTVAIGARGELWSFGSNTAHRLGTGTNRLDYNAPHRVLAPSGEYADATSLPYRVVFNGTAMHFDTPPVERNGRVLVPLRAIFEKIGASVSWNNATQTATSRLGDAEVRVTIGSRTAYVGGEPVSLDVAAVKTSDWRTLVPLRFVSEAFGASVAYIASEHIIDIRTRDARFELTADAAARIASQSATIRSTFTEGIASASGVAIHGGGLVLTNRHAVDGASEVSVTVNGVGHRAEVYYLDDEYDYAILKIGAHVSTPMLAALPLRRDDLALVAATPDAKIARVTDTRYGGTMAFVLDCEVQKGLSGSGVYNRDLELAGIVYAGVGERSYAACVPMAVMRERIASAIAYYGLR